MIQEKLQDIPQYSGCYLFKDEVGQIIYIGMSKFLPKRVSSYFQKKHKDQKTLILVENIKDVDFMITSSEQEALLLEEELIKIYKPKFNIKGKDDKSRKWSICFTEDNFPKLEIVRNKKDERCSLDFTNGIVCTEVFNLIHSVFDLRSCSYDLSTKNIESGKFKECLEYQMKRCEAPCTGKITSFQYLTKVMMVKKLMNLEFEKLKGELKSLMKYYASKLEFEKAHLTQHKLKTLDEVESKLEVVRIRHYNKKAFEVKRSLNLKKLPLVIEAFDNSHNQGHSNVAASVRYVNDKPLKSEYRKYNIKTVTGVDDYKSFDEVIKRRLVRIVNEKQNLPDLLLIDGGKGQLSVAKKVLEELNLTDKIDLISISKNDSHKSALIHTTDGKEFDIKDNQAYIILSKIQEEVHRFAIKFHREKRSKNFIKGI